MATQFYVAGASLVSIGGTPLGYVEDEFPVEFIGYHKDVNVDYAGMMPADVSFAGMGALMAYTLINYDAAVLDSLKAWLYGATQGFGDEGSIGTLLLAESKTYSMTFSAPYASKSQFSSMTGLWTFPNVYPADSFSFGLSTKVKKERVILRAIPITHPDGSWTLYTRT